jgi:hypothetical protein
LSNNKERLGKRFGIHTWGKPGIDETGSKARTDKTPPNRLGSASRSPLRNKRSNSPYARKQSGSPLRQKSGSPPRNYPSYNPSSEYTNQLANDNASLQRRLNLVLQELDRVNRDRSNLSQKLGIGQKDVDQMKRMLQEEDLDDKINRDLQMDLNATRDANKDTKVRIADVDHQRADAIN